MLFVFFLGAPHHCVSLNKLVNVLKAKKEEVRADTYSKEEKLYKLLKYSTEVLSEFETKTEEMIQLLHTTRDNQVIFNLMLFLFQNLKVKVGC